MTICTPPFAKGSTTVAILAARFDDNVLDVIPAIYSDLVLGGIALARQHLVLHRLLLLIEHFEWPAIGRHHIHLEFAIGAVQLGIAGVIGERVLVANGLADIVKDFRQFALEARVIEPARRSCARRCSVGCRPGESPAR